MTQNVTHCPRRRLLPRIVRLIHSLFSECWFILFSGCTEDAHQAKGHIFSAKELLSLYCEIYPLAPYINTDGLLIGCWHTGPDYPWLADRAKQTDGHVVNHDLNPIGRRGAGVSVAGCTFDVRGEETVRNFVHRSILADPRGGGGGVTQNRSHHLAQTTSGRALKFSPLIEKTENILKNWSKSKPIGRDPEK